MVAMKVQQQAVLPGQERSRVKTGQAISSPVSILRGEQALVTSSCEPCFGISQWAPASTLYRGRWGSA